MLISALLVFTVWIVAVPVGANSASVTRELPDYVKQSEMFVVTLNQSGFFWDVGIVWEVLPEGFEYVYGSYTGGAPDKVTYDSITRTLKMPFAGDTSIAYGVNASSYEQTAVFSGTWRTMNSQGNIINGTVIGDTTVTVEKGEIFDTGSGTSPSISGIHKGTIKPNVTIEVSTLYTYPCPGTGGHTEYVQIWNNTGWNATATWEGYVGGWHTIVFNSPFTLIANETYNYTIRTGSYPQIHHEFSLATANGRINCTEFIDVNGNVHYDWIPAIKLFW